MKSESWLQFLAEISGTEELRSDRHPALLDTKLLDSMHVVELIVIMKRKFVARISPAEFDRECWATRAKFAQDTGARLANLA